jgi:urea transport system permease protein
MPSSEKSARSRSFSLACLLIAALPALARPFEDAVAKFANDDFSDTEEAIGAVATAAIRWPIPSSARCRTAG